MGFVKFWKGLLEELPQETVEGKIYVTTDEGGLYIDIDGERVKLNDFELPEFGDVVTHDVAEGISENSTDIPTSGQVYEAISGINVTSDYSIGINPETGRLALFYNGDVQEDENEGGNGGDDEGEQEI